MRRHLPLRKKLLASLIRTAVVATALGPTISWAQTADATLRGKAPANATVTAKNISTGAVRRTTASGDGGYALVGLPPGAYTIDAGAGTEQNVTLSVASTLTLDLTAAPTAPSTTTTTLEGVSVTATTLQEVKTSEIGTVVSQRQIETVPQITRNFLEFADTVPGMVFSVDPKGNTSLQGGGISTSGINVFIDGVGQKNYVLPSGLTGQTGSQGNPFPQLAIGEYKVITSNYKAEYDQISSAAITAETKSGTNEFHGDVFGDYTDSSLRKSTPAEIAASKKPSTEQKEYGFDIGGPIIKDTMHFFLAYESKKFVTPVAVVPGGTVGLADELPQSAKDQIGPTSLPFDEDLWFGKVDWELSDRDRIELSGKYRDETAISGVSGAVAASAAINTVNTDKRYDLRWNHSADSWFNELLFTYENSFYNPTSLNFGAAAIYTEVAPNNPVVLDTGPADPRATQNKGQKGPAIADNLTFNDISWHGDHVVKMGFKFKSVKLTAADAGNFNPQFSYDVTPDGTLTVPYQVLFPNPAPGTNPTAQTTDKQYGGYIQDDWSVNDKLTLNLGVRYDYEKTPSYLNYVTPSDVVAALNSPNNDPTAPAGQTYAQALALGGVNVNDYISNGHNRKQQKDAIAPRLGFSYDFLGDEAHVLHGGAGRSYDRDIFEILQLEQTKASLSELTLTFPNQFHTCAPGPNCLAFDPSFMDLATLQALYGSSTAGKEIDAINNNLKTPYSDQFSLGIRNKVGDWNTDATVQHIVGKDGLVFTLGNRYPTGAFWENGSQPWGNGVPGFGSFIIGNNGVETKTTQILLSAEKPYTKESGWAATLAYTYTNTKQNNDNNDLTDQYAFDQATIGDYPFIPSKVAKHRFVATGSVDGPWDMLYSMKLTLATPLPDDANGCYGFGSNGAPNVPFSTGSFCTPIAPYPGGQSFITGGKIFGYRSIDLQVTKNFDLTAGLSAYIRVDALNVFNYHNYTDYIENFGSNGIENRTPVTYNTNGNIDGVPRTLKFSVGFRW
ncbi:MAG TPA: TonB-dependent receptor [Rudaea sp.]|jgi:outer membrane receptor protein involved in Fe transport|nr:TonB-dependent receptor [Rudaea sp.]